MTVVDIREEHTRCPIVRREEVIALFRLVTPLGTELLPRTIPIRWIRSTELIIRFRLDDDIDEHSTRSDYYGFLGCLNTVLGSDPWKEAMACAKKHHLDRGAAGVVEAVAKIIETPAVTIRRPDRFDIPSNPATIFYTTAAGWLLVVRTGEQWEDGTPKNRNFDPVTVHEAVVWSSEAGFDHEKALAEFKAKANDFTTVKLPI